MTLGMKTAPALPRDTQAPISSISEQVGIDNPSYFYRLFKKIYGCTPKKSRDAGSGAQAASYIHVLDVATGKATYGVGISSNITRASIRGIFSAVNRLFY